MTKPEGQATHALDKIERKFGRRAKPGQDRLKLGGLVRQHVGDDQPLRVCVEGADHDLDAGLTRPQRRRLIRPLAGQDAQTPPRSGSAIRRS